ncbi:MAG: glycosyltransferase family 2 protein [Phycisphaerales bacterium]
MKALADANLTAVEAPPADRAPTPATPRQAPPEPEPAACVATARVAAIIVTWNRREALDVVLRALAGQQYGGRHGGRLDVVVVDNGSTDGTADSVIEHWAPDRVVDNATADAAEPRFEDSPLRTTRNGHLGGRGAISTLTLVRNAHNLGGCGGFNTGLANLERNLDTPQAPLDYAWLVDDDVDLPPGALAQLVRTAEGDPGIGIVGSRTVDFDDRQTTIETTIYFDFENGWMGPEPARGHRLEASHRAWAERTGGTRGRLEFSGVREVDVVSACSLLARWRAVKEVGFWDRRYFIYCDDADWCLRFGKAGYRVVCDLDAVVFHTYWLSKLTPVRAYYSQRNLVWVIQKVLPRGRVRRAVARRLGSLLVDSRKAMTHCRLFHAEIIRRTAHDIVTGRAGKLDHEGPWAVPLIGALDGGGALRPGARVMVMCSHPESIAWADELRARVTYGLIDRGRAADQPRWVYMVRDTVPDPRRPNALGLPGPERVVFEPNRASKWRAQRGWIRNPAEAVVIFDQSNELPLIRGRYTIHIDRKRPGLAQPERDGWPQRLRFLGRWAGTAARCLLYAGAARPRPHQGKYGG